MKVKYLAQAKVLKSLRYSQSLSLKKLAELSGINQTRLHRLESGIGELVLSECRELSNVLKKDVYRLITKEDEATFSELVELSLIHKGESFERICDIELTIAGGIFKAYSCSIAHRDLLFYCDKGTASYDVNTINGVTSALLVDWSIDSDTKK